MGISSLLLTHWSQGSQAWQQTPKRAEPSHWPWGLFLIGALKPLDKQRRHLKLCTKFSRRALWLWE